MATLEQGRIERRLAAILAADTADHSPFPCLRHAGSRIPRREVIALLGGAAAWPLAATAQQPTTTVIGFLSNSSPNYSAGRATAYRQALNEAGYVEGQSVAIEYRWVEGHYDRLPPLAAELVQRRAAVILADGINPALAAKAATSTIPIVFVTGSDPVKHSLVASLNRPGGNVTGVSVLTVGLVAKRFEVLCEVIPDVTTIGLLVNPTQATTEFQLRDMQDAARTLGRQILVLNASSESDIDAAFAKLVEQRAGGLVVGSDGFITGRARQLAALAARHMIPAIVEWREFAATGGLMSYGPSETDAFRQAGVYTGRILKGATPADLPVYQSTKVELVINLKTAKALGLTIPLSLLGRADEVIE
jgi:putative ABC transport system substrate-binding protein